MAGRDRVELAEDGLLDLHLLRHRLDHEVDVGEVLVGGRADDPAEHLVEAGVGLLLGHLFLFDQPGEFALGDRARFLDRGIDELLVDVLDDDGDVGGGDRLRDLAAHGAAADDGGLGNEHVAGSSGVLALGMRPAPRVRRLSGLPPSLGSDERDRRGARRRGSRADRPAARRGPLLLGRHLRRRALPARRSARRSRFPPHALAAAAQLRPRRQALAEVPRRHRPRRLPLPLLPRARSRGRAAKKRNGPEAIEVNVLVHGDYILTVHRESVSLPEILPDYSPEGRSEQYVVYVVLDAMVATAFDALSATELALEGLQVWPAKPATRGCGPGRCGRSTSG